MKGRKAVNLDRNDDPGPHAKRLSVKLRKAIPYSFTAPHCEPVGEPICVICGKLFHCTAFSLQFYRTPTSASKPPKTQHTGKDRVAHNASIKTSSAALLVGAAYVL